MALKRRYKVKEVEIYESIYISEVNYGNKIQKCKFYAGHTIVSAYFRLMMALKYVVASLGKLTVNAVVASITDWDVLTHDFLVFLPIVNGCDVVNHNCNMK